MTTVCQVAGSVGSTICGRGTSRRAAPGVEILPVFWSGAGIREITLYDPVACGIQTLYRLAAQLSLIVDLVALGGTTGGRRRGAAHSAGVAPSSGFTTVSSQPASRAPRGASRACRPMTLTARLAAVHAIVEQTHRLAGCCHRWTIPGSHRRSPKPPCEFCPSRSNPTRGRGSRSVRPSPSSPSCTASAQRSGSVRSPTSHRLAHPLAPTALRIEEIFISSSPPGRGRRSTP